MIQITNLFTPFGKPNSDFPNCLHGRSFQPTSPDLNHPS